MAEPPLCEQEQRVGTGAAARKPWLARALGGGTFQLVYECLEASVKVRTPLAKHDVCIAFLSFVSKGSWTRQGSLILVE